MRSGLARLVACAILAAGCFPTLPHGRARPPNTKVPGSYPGQQADTGPSSAEMSWSDFFADPKLRALIDAALKNSQEINIVSLEAEVARTEIMARRGEYLPSVDFTAGAGIEKVGKYTSQGVSDDASQVAPNLPSFGFGFEASWQLDIWSKLRNATKAATLRYLSSKEGRNFAITRLVGELASSYYELMALDAELAVLEQNIQIQSNALAVVHLQKEAAKVTELAVKRFEAEVLKNQSRRYTIAQEIIEVENRINFLVGRFPQHVDRSTQDFVELVPPGVKTGVPARLLENRADVKQAQLLIVASDLDFKVAKASFYPQLNLGATIGYQSFDFLKIVSTPASLAYSIAAGLLVPLFNRAQLNASYIAANTKQLQAVYQYERAILNGYTEVTRLLALIHNLQTGYDLQVQQVAKLTESIDISSQLFASARADYMEVLLTRRDALEAQMELIENKKRQMTAAVGLYQALGGGWR